MANATLRERQTQYKSCPLDMYLITPVSAVCRWVMLGFVTQPDINYNIICWWVMLGFVPQPNLQILEVIKNE